MQIISHLPRPVHVPNNQPKKAQEEREEAALPIIRMSKCHRPEFGLICAAAGCSEYFLTVKTCNRTAAAFLSLL